MLFLLSFVLPLQQDASAVNEMPAQSLKQQEFSSDIPALKPDKSQVDLTAAMTQAEPSPEMPQSVSDKYSDILTTGTSNPIAESAVNKSLHLFSEKIKERFAVYLERSGKYLDMMKEVLRGKDIPEDMVFLSLIESGFNPNAYSVARAVGPWQFISATAKRYGLKIDWWRDERKDPVKSTAAAASYLSDLYDMFGSWNLAMAAYNAGEGKILRALNRTKSDDYWSLLNTKHIKNETKQYVPKFIAAGIIATNPEEYGFENIKYQRPFEYDEVTLYKPIDLDVAAECAQTDLGIIRDLNPELRRWSTPPNVSSYTLRIPSGRKKTFMENLAEIPDEKRFTLATYTVRKGDTIKKIAAKAGVPVNVVLELNDGIKTFNAGEKVYIPPKGKFQMDRDDKVAIKKASYKKPRKKSRNKTLVTSLNKRDNYVND